MIPQSELEKIRNVLIVAEQGRQTMNYSEVYRYHDGPNNCRQITLSIGFTQYGNLGAVLEVYGKAQGKLSEQLGPWAKQMQNRGTVDSNEFINLLKEAGKDPVMQKVQEEMFDKFYLAPGVKWGETEGFTLPLSFLVICDSYLHSGSILSSIRSKFAERTPAQGGNEKEWIEQYTHARHNWLATHSKEILHATVYRTRYYKELIASNDWDLRTYHTVAMNGLKPLAVA
jgi:chitosanase